MLLLQNALGTQESLFSPLQFCPGNAGGGVVVIAAVVGDGVSVDTLDVELVVELAVIHTKA